MQAAEAASSCAKPAILELGQALGQDIGADSRQVGLQFRETARPEHQFAQHQQRPALANQIKRMGQAASIVISPFWITLPRLSYFF